MYWLNRAIDAFAASDLNGQQIGSAENAEDNSLAYIRAMQCHMRLTEVYGVSNTVTTPAGTRVDVFQAVLALLLISAFYLRDFIAAFSVHLHMTGHWRTALDVMAAEGLQDGLQLRLPLTWSDRDSKIGNIVGWTTSKDLPRGSRHAASAILDLWTNDLVRLAERLSRGEPGLDPKLFELPFLRFGKVLVQLPWVVDLQNNSTAAINTLRRLGARRDEAKEETRRIEKTLGQLFESRGFKVAFNWEPADKEAGEIDLICSLDGVVLVLEVKSTFVRGSQREAWLHATTTLRKAGHQLHRKVQSLKCEIFNSETLRSALSISSHPHTPTICGWIIDTSIERDHCRFDGFLKVSVEEIMIALRDDRHLLWRPISTLDGHSSPLATAGSTAGNDATLYPDVFTAKRFAAVIETGAVWQGI